MTNPLKDDVPPLLDGRFPLPLDQPFTAAHAARAGIGPNVLTRLVRDGLIRRMIKGVYVATQVEDTLVLRAQCLSLVVPPDAVVTDRTAGWLFTANVLAPNDHLQLPPVSMFRPPGHNRLRNSLCVSGQRTLLPEDVATVHGVKVTTPLRTAWDLGRFLHRDQAMGGLDAMLRVGRRTEDQLGFTEHQLVGGVERFARRRGVVQLRELAPLADPRAESQGESTLRLRWRDAPDLPTPRPQVPVPNNRGSVYRLDLGIEEIRFAAEYDGERWHSSDEDRKHDEERREWLRRELFWTIEVFRRDDVYGPREDVAGRLRSGIAAARRRMGEYRPPYS